MSDDWRLHFSLADDGAARELADLLAGFRSEHRLGSSFGERVVVSRDGSELFCYTDTREQAEAAELAIRSLATEHHLQLSTQLRRWHPVAEEWEDPDRPLPETDAQRSGEHAELVEQEQEESREQGFPDFEVRVRCKTRHDAGALAERLRSDGITNVHRAHFVVVGATDEDSANALAERIRGEAPPGTEVTAEASIQEITAEAPAAATPYNNPFAVFGGLGG